MQTHAITGAVEVRPETIDFNRQSEDEMFVLDLCAAAEPEPLLYDRKTVAKLLSVSPRTVAYMIDRGILPVRRIGSRVLHPAEAVRRIAQKGCGEIYPKAS